MKSFTKTCVSAAVACMVGVAGFAVLPAAAYGEQSNAVTSARSFPGVIEGGERLFAEASSVSVEDDIDWGGVESLDVPQTKSQAEKDAEAAQKRAEEEAKRQAEQQAAAAATASRSSSTAAASRSEVRTSSDSGLAWGASLDYSIAPAGFNPNHEIGDVGNRYAGGNCTWWAYERRHQLGLPVGSFFGNGAQWAASASAMGYWVDSTPRMVGDIMVFQGGQAGSSWGYGHVAIVEEIYADGSVRVSEMGSGFAGGFCSSRVFSDTGNYQYIHF
ncbi:CHAP domain-containing protein [uncultured Bifidobacterium sp.]|uniref:CHAP domain-containing protein n=1 Tax=uncultured Bifidobacterium sp. TaxID=165187 RepID=UPI00258D9983|nr:CHAP domain-containing protein [uncultured Bifidobacterium sp.]